MDNNKCVRKLASEEVRNVLLFLTWQQPLVGVSPDQEEQGMVEHGRSLILEWLVACLYE